MSVFSVDQAYRLKANHALVAKARAPMLALGPGPVNGTLDARSTLDIACECSAQDCSARVRIRLSDYEAERRGLRRLVIAPGHELDSPVHLVARTDAYEIVEPWF